MKNIIVKSFVLFLVTAMLANIASASPLRKKRPVKPIRITSVGATVTGFVELSGGREIPGDLENIFKGSGTTAIGTKTINVKGTYKAGANYVSVEEDTVVSSSMPKYWFDLPIPAKVSAYSHGSYVTRDTQATLAYASQDDIQGTGLGADSAGSHNLEELFKKKMIGGKRRTFTKKLKTKLRNLAIQRFLAAQINSIVDVGALMSVEKVTADRGKRPSGTARVTGVLSRPGTSAKGRFQLDMVFDK